MGLLVVGGLVAAYFLFFAKKPPVKLPSFAAAPQVSAAAAPIDPDAAAREHAAKLKAEIMGRIFAAEDLIRIAGLAQRAAESIDPKAGSGASGTVAPQ